MGNIQRDVWPIRRISWRKNAPRDVKMISIHQPVRPQMIKFLRNIETSKGICTIFMFTISNGGKKYSKTREKCYEDKEGKVDLLGSCIADCGSGICNELYTGVVFS